MWCCVNWETLFKCKFNEIQLLHRFVSSGIFLRTAMTDKLTCNSSAANATVHVWNDGVLCLLHVTISTDCHAAWYLECFMCTVYVYAILHLRVPELCAQLSTTRLMKDWNLRLKGKRRRKVCQWVGRAESMHAWYLEIGDFYASRVMFISSLFCRRTSRYICWNIFGSWGFIDCRTGWL